ncbi:hypothetical protein [Glutamicibacter sp.]|uniref:hypothetical protein n=1 Tax=Glutamicibacter sp. TaxID=1931995 RepID=UPI002FE1180D
MTATILIEINDCLVVSATTAVAFARPQGFGRLQFMGFNLEALNQGKELYSQILQRLILDDTTALTGYFGAQFQMLAESQASLVHLNVNTVRDVVVQERLRGWNTTQFLATSRSERRALGFGVRNRRGLRDDPAETKSWLADLAAEIPS